MIRTLLFLFLFSTALPVLSQDQPDYNAENIPSALKSRANAVLRNMETTVDMRAPENVMLNVKMAITVLNKNGDERASLTLFYNKSTAIKSIKGVVLNSFGQPVGKFNQNNFTDESAVSDFSLYEDARIKRFVPNSITYPYTVVYEYEVRYKQNLIIPDWYASPEPDVAVEKNSYTFISRPDDKIRVKSYNFKGAPTEIRSEKLNMLTWKVENINAFRPEPYSPDPKTYLTYVKIAPEQFSYFGYKGSYNDWHELGKWVYDDLIKDQQVLAPEVVQEVNTLVKDLKTDKEKAKKIYEYVQKKTRYISIQIGIGGFQPFPASEVHRVSYGDCKALVNYTQSLLKAVGVNSMYCVVYAGNLKKNMDAEFASMDQGNHIILAIPLKSDTAWVDCTSTDNPFGYLGSFTDDRSVLACTAEGGKMLRTPALTTSLNLLKRKAELTIESDGSVSGSLSTDFSGAQYDNYAHLIHEPYTEQLKKLKEEYDIDNINFSSFNLAQKKDDSPVTSESLSLAMPRYASKTNNRLYLVLNAFNKTRPIPEVKTRMLPVYINRGYTDEDEIVYNLPEGYIIESRPQDKQITCPFGTYTISTVLEGRKLIYKRKLVLNDGSYKAEKYADFSAFFNEVSMLDHNKVILKLAI